MASHSKAAPSPPKARRTSIACTCCRQRKKKCLQEEGRERCVRCNKLNQVCRYIEVANDRNRSVSPTLSSPTEASSPQDATGSILVKVEHDQGLVSDMPSSNLPEAPSLSLHGVAAPSAPIAPITAQSFGSSSMLIDILYSGPPAFPQQTREPWSLFNSHMHGAGIGPSPGTPQAYNQSQLPSEIEMTDPSAPPAHRRQHFNAEPGFAIDAFASTSSSFLSTLTLPQAPVEFTSMDLDYSGLFSTSFDPSLNLAMSTSIYDLPCAHCSQGGLCRLHFADFSLYTEMSDDDEDSY